MSLRYWLLSDQAPSSPKCEQLSVSQWQRWTMIELGSDKNIIARKTPCHRIYFLQQVLYICEVVPLAAKPRSSLVWRLFYWQPTLPVRSVYVSTIKIISFCRTLPSSMFTAVISTLWWQSQVWKGVSLNRTFPQLGSVKWQQLPAISARKCWMPVPAT